MEIARKHVFLPMNVTDNKVVSFFFISLSSQGEGHEANVSLKPPPESRGVLPTRQEA
jgi:hypothetical protein